MVADKLVIAADACARGRTAEDAARLIGWSRALLYRHQQAQAARESAPMERSSCMRSFRLTIAHRAFRAVILLLA